MEIALTKISSKGQIVIPTKMRKNLHEGDELLVIQNDDQIIMKKASALDKNLKEDLAFAKKTEEAWQRYEKGEFTSLSADAFLKKLKQW